MTSERVDRSALAPANDLAALRQAYWAFAQGDPEPFLELLAEDVVVDFPTTTGLPWSGRLVGKGEVIGAMRNISELGKYTHFELLEIYQHGSDYMVHMREAFEFAATSEVVELEQVFLYRMSEGKVSFMKEWTDTAAIRDAYQRAMLPRSTHSDTEH